MTQEIAGISFKVSTNELEKGSKALNELQQAASKPINKVILILSATVLYLKISPIVQMDWVLQKKSYQH
ncbi:hypothetical protein [Providencia sneebia]|uniref:Uncharacterized protein n=1 Tax=Providencia sneebia DSM 19967 TaxID=1141660 RepID=K8WE68_9GAMM|nr:hypothetical protein [Providencia sneebia]EKT55767.1 hypothetical protein OO7_12359 [Providencia sneebia DSM 19967]